MLAGSVRLVAAQDGALDFRVSNSILWALVNSGVFGTANLTPYSQRHWCFPLERAARNPIATGPPSSEADTSTPLLSARAPFSAAAAVGPQIVDAKSEGAGGELLDRLRCAVIGIQGGFGNLNLQLGRDFLGQLYWRAVGSGPDVGGLR